MPSTEPDEDDVEVESEDSGNRLTKPWDPKQIRITTKNFSFRECVAQIDEGTLDLAPDFQRAFVWKERQRTRLIESIALGIPLPVFYFNQDRDGAFQVVDGVQRLTTVNRFFKDQDRLAANDLEYLKDLAGKTYSELDTVVRRRIANTMIVTHVIEPQTPDDVKYDIFYRVNTSGSPLTAQEIRHCMSRPRSREFLRALIELDSFDRATEWRFWAHAEDGTDVRDDRRMLNRELALRFCAFRATSLDDYRDFASLDAFLLDFTRRIDGRGAGASLGDSELADLQTSFDRAMQNARVVLGRNAFRRPSAGGLRRGQLNRAVFEAQAIALADLTREQVAAHRDALEALLRGLFAVPEYDASVRFGTGDAEKVRLRLEANRTAVSEAIRL